MSTKSIQPLWQLLLKARSLSEDVTLNCDECFLILEYLADIKQQIGADIEFLRTLARRHLSCCPDCREYYLRRLEQLERIQQSNERRGASGDSSDAGLVIPAASLLER